MNNNAWVDMGDLGIEDHMPTRFWRMDAIIDSALKCPVSCHVGANPDHHELKKKVGVLPGVFTVCFRKTLSK